MAIKDKDNYEKAFNKAMQTSENDRSENNDRDSSVDDEQVSVMFMPSPARAAPRASPKAPPAARPSKPTDADSATILNISPVPKLLQMPPKKSNEDLDQITDGNLDETKPSFYPKRTRLKTVNRKDL